MPAQKATSGKSAASLPSRLSNRAWAASGTLPISCETRTCAGRSMRSQTMSPTVKLYTWIERAP
ncbi:hypothetical protein Ato02nite_010400 [Paractinoplanes toevensis]|uniref:Uncharacterized protein n=1 Tax=Paractinoplanes toevensis TaxID=571911 RepID=A0A919T6E4_9ACTN|nr:hypothetical protein Ato02nite_010400 [Actinoplanes toevensis]